MYALTAAGTTLPAVRGVARERLRLISTGRLAAIVGALQRAPAPSADTIRRYDATLRALADRVPALLPARFGTCFDDREELAFVLRSRQVALRHALAHVRNRAQMTVRVVGTGEAGKAAPPAAPASDGRAYLHARAAAAARERHIPGFDPVREAVRRWVRDERVEKRGRVASVYHLVPRASAAAYSRALQRAAASAGLRVVMSGPWPPYAFADLL